MGRNILESSLQSASFSIIFQVLFRCITFMLNAFIVRTLGHDVLGIMNVRLLLLESTILFLSKEPLLKACLTNTKTHNWAQVINLIWLSIPISMLLSVFLAYIWLNVLTPVDDIFSTQYKWGCYSIALSCIIEQSTQSVVLVVQSFCFVKLKIVFDTLYVLTRTFVFVFLVIHDPNSAIGAFSIAQILSAIVLSLSYYVFFAWYIPKLKVFNKKEQLNSKLFSDMKDFPFDSVLDFFPGVMSNDNKKLNKDLCILTMSFAKQSIVKQILTEGEKYVMTISPVMTFTQQAMYDIVNNLGSLAARFIFRPIEESAYFYFTQMIQRDVPLKNQNEKSVSEVAYVLKQLCNVILSFGMIICTFGQNYSYTLLYLYGGKNLVDNVLPVTLLQYHCYAIILLAVNGITEGFVFATMSNKQLDRYNYMMVLFSIIFLIVSYVLTVVLGPIGFIIANCINMSARIIHSLHYIWKIYKNTSYCPIEGLKVRWKFIGILTLSSYATKFSEDTFLPGSIIAHISIGIIFLFFSLAVWSFDNKELLKIGYDKLRKK